VAITPFQEEGGQDGLGADDDDALVAEDEADGLDDEAHRPKEKSKICASVAQAGPRRRRWVKTARRQFSGPNNRSIFRPGAVPSCSGICSRWARRGRGVEIADESHDNGPVAAVDLDLNSSATDMVSPACRAASLCAPA
jgi:hypothetical protein